MGAKITLILFFSGIVACFLSLCGVWDVFTDREMDTRINKGLFCKINEIKHFLSLIALSKQHLHHYITNMMTPNSQVHDRPLRSSVDSTLMVPRSRTSFLSFSTKILEFTSY